MRSVRIFAARNSEYRGISQNYGLMMSLCKPSGRPALSCRMSTATESSIFVGVANYYERTACSQSVARNQKRNSKGEASAGAMRAENNVDDGKTKWKDDTRKDSATTIV